MLAASGSALSGPNDIRDQLASSDIPRPEVTLVDRADASGSTTRAMRSTAAPPAATTASWSSTASGAATSRSKARSARRSPRRSGATCSRRARAATATACNGRSPATISRRASTARWSRSRMKGLPVLHRYFALRQRMLGLPDLHYYDIYPPLVRGERRFTLADIRTTTLEALRPLGPRIWPAARPQGTAARWMDPSPAPGQGVRRLYERRRLRRSPLSAAQHGRGL